MHRSLSYYWLMPTYDLEDRTLQFAQQVRILVLSIPKTIVSFEDGKQLVRSSGSVAANYIEANESLSDRDFLHRIKICKKEAKECTLWLKLLSGNLNGNLLTTANQLLKETNELKLIFAKIIENKILKLEEHVQ